MKLIWEPTVYLIGTQVMDNNAVMSYLRDQGFEHTAWPNESNADNADCEDIVEMAGRVCYQSFPPKKGRNHQEYMAHILEVSHGSVVEHAVFSLLITGVSRSLTHELIRHRAGMSYSELSQRYADCSQLGVVVPPACLRYYRDWQAWMFAKNNGVQNLDEKYFSRGCEIWNAWYQVIRNQFEYYKSALEHLEEDAPIELSKTDRRKWARQAARSNLPECTATQIFVTGNARSWRHFLELRGSRHADVEIRRLANHVHDILVEEAVGLFGDYEKTDLCDGTFELTTKNKKV